MRWKDLFLISLFYSVLKVSQASKISFVHEVKFSLYKL